MGFLIFGLIFIVILAIAIISSNDQGRSLSAVEKVQNHVNSLKADTFDDYLDHKKEWHQEKIKGDR